MLARRPAGIHALGAFFAFGAVVSFTAGISLLFPGSFLDPIWRLNPRAYGRLATMNPWAPSLLAVVCVACAAAAYGLLHGRRWGYRLAVALLLVNLAGDLINVILGTEPHAVVGIPVVALLLVYLGTFRVRAFFSRPAAGTADAD